MLPHADQTDELAQPHPAPHRAQVTTLKKDACYMMSASDSDFAAKLSLRRLTIRDFVDGQLER